MAGSPTSKGKGANTSRSEIVTIRLSPKLRYLAEIASRVHRRTLSSYIEWALEDSLSTVYLDDNSSIRKEAESLWDIDEADRFAKLALKYPGLLTHEEQILWKLIRENGYLWRGSYSVRGDSKEWNWEINESTLIYKRLQEYWPQFVKVARGKADRETLPKWKETEEIKKTEETDIPF